MAGFGRPKTAGKSLNAGRSPSVKGLGSGSARVVRGSSKVARKSGGMGSGVGKGGGAKGSGNFGR